MTEPREYRLRKGVTLVKAAVLADLSPARVSEIERHPEHARPGELEKLRDAVNRAALEQANRR